jgi:hypothetical protein
MSKIKRCLYCNAKLFKSGEYCSIPCKDKYLQYLEKLNFKECPVIKNCDTMSEDEIKMQKKWIKNNKKKAKTQMVCSGGRI